MVADGWELYWSCLLACHMAWALQSEYSKRSGKKLQGFFSFVLFFFFLNDTDLCFKSSYDLASDVSKYHFCPCLLVKQITKANLDSR